MRLVLVPGWHEKSKYLEPFVVGRHGLRGLQAHGFECVLAPDLESGGMRARIERFAEWLAQMHAREAHRFPIGTFGYSAGGLITRGFLRAYPERASWIAGTFQLAPPNAGLVANFSIPFMRLLKMPADMLKDMDVGDDFMAWLNGTTGHWEHSPFPRHQRWVLDAEPWIAPPGHPILAVCGVSERRGPPSDGIVETDWATLGGRMPSYVIHGKTANHLNVGAAFDGSAFLTRGWHIDDRVWPLVVKQAVRFFRGTKPK